MSRIVPFNHIPDSSVFPDGIYRLTVEKFDVTQTKEREGKQQKFMFALTGKIVAPEQYKNMLYSEYFVIGTEQDPDAEQVETWQSSIGARSFKRFVKALGIPVGDEEDAESLAASIRGAEFLATIVTKVEPDTKKINGVEQDNPYKGRVNNNTSAYWKVGEKEPGLTNGHDASAAKPTARRTVAGAGTAAKPAAAAAPSDEVRCSACPPTAPKVKRSDLRAHAQQHMQDIVDAE